MIRVLAPTSATNVLWVSLTKTPEHVREVRILRIPTDPRSLRNPRVLRDPRKPRDPRTSLTADSKLKAMGAEAEHAFGSPQALIQYLTFHESQAV